MGSPRARRQARCVDLDSSRRVYSDGLPDVRGSGGGSTHPVPVRKTLLSVLLIPKPLFVYSSQRSHLMCGE